MAAHAFLQLPQLSGSVSEFDSHPSVGSPLQSAKCAAQCENWHCPATHISTLPSVSQPLPQAPQFVALRDRSAHSVPQHVSPDGHDRPGAHPGSQRDDTRLQIVPSGQSASAPQPTHVCDVVSHRGPLGASFAPALASTLASLLPASTAP
jgi:hypothetical protein